jgi:hypothetical protein
MMNRKERRAAANARTTTGSFAGCGFLLGCPTSVHTFTMGELRGKYWECSRRLRGRLSAR